MATMGARNSAPLPRSAGLINSIPISNQSFPVCCVSPARPCRKLCQPPSLAFEPARDYGDVWALTELWNTPGFDLLRQIFKRTRHNIDVEALVRVMVLNRLCDPDSKVAYCAGSKPSPCPA